MMHGLKLLAVTGTWAFFSLLGGCAGDSAGEASLPATPLGLTATPGDGQVNLSWDADPDGMRSGVYVWQGASPDSLAERDFVAAPDTTFTATGLVNGTTCHFALQAEDAERRRSDLSATVAATPEADAEPVPPARPATFQVYAGDAQVEVSWTLVPVFGGQSRGVHLYWGTDPDDLDQTRFVALPQTSTTVTGLDNGQDYGFAARVEDEEGLLSPRTEVRVTRPSEYDTTGPTIVSTSPADGAYGVDAEALLSVTFSEPMHPSSIEISSDPGRSLRTLQWNSDNTELVTGPRQPWQEGESYWVKVTGTDRWGNPIEGPDAFAFRVGYESLLPEVIGCSPGDGMEEVPTTSRLSLSFDQPMDPVSTHRALGTDPDIPLGYEVDESGRTFTWIPQDPLLPGQNYTVTLGTNAMTAAGEHLAAEFVFDFATASGPDEDPPSVVSYRPENGVNGVDRHFELAVAFSEPMDHAWTQAALVFLSHPSMEGTFTWTNQGTVMRFHPSKDPDPGEVVRWKVLGEARDLAGNSLGQELTAEFQLMRSFEIVIQGNGAMDGVVGLLSDGGEYGDHWIYTDDEVLHVGNINYTYLGPAVQRGFYAFELDALPEDLTRITFAEISFTQGGMWGECEEIGNFFLDNVAYGPDLTLDDFDTPVLEVEVCDPEGVCEVGPYSLEGQCPTYWTHLLWSAVVTPAVRNDWAHRQARMHLCQWRLRIENEQTGATGQTMFFRASHWSVPSSYRPRMLVRYEMP